MTTANLDHPNAVRGEYSELRVLRSAAGYYIGTLWVEYDASGEVCWECPGSRDSEYFETEQEADAVLPLYQ